MKYLPMIGLLFFVSCTDSETSSTTTRKISINEPVTSTIEAPSVRVPAEIVNNTSSQVSHDPADPFVIFVAPPKKAQIKISSPFLYTTNMGWCGSAHSYPGVEKQWKEDVKAVDELKNTTFPKWQLQEELEIRISEENEIGRKNKLIEELRILNIEIADLERKIERKERVRKISGSLLDTYFKDLYQEYAHAEVEWSSDWERNLEQLKEENPEYTFEFENVSDVKIRMNARGLELPAVQMIMNIDDTLELREINRELVAGTIPLKLKNTYRITGFAACAMNKPTSFGLPDKKEIFIDVEIH